MVDYQSDPGPATDPVAIDVSSEDQEFDPPLRGISIGTAGDLKIDGLSVTAIVIPEACLATGVQHAISIKKIYSAGTTASNMIGWE